MTVTITEEGSSFIDLVRRIRRAQREYFCTRDRVLLAHAKQLEQEVDKQLEAGEMEASQRQAREKYPELFPDTVSKTGVTPTL